MQLPRTHMEPTPPDETVSQCGPVLEVEFGHAGRKPVADTVAMRVREVLCPPDDSRVISVVIRQSAAAQRADG
jgi:hypothetical protein